MKLTGEVVHTNTHLLRVSGVFMGQGFACSKIPKSNWQKRKNKTENFRFWNKIKLICTPQCKNKIENFRLWMKIKRIHTLHLTENATPTHCDPYTLQPPHTASPKHHNPHTLQLSNPLHFIHCAYCNRHILQSPSSAIPTF